MQTRIESGLLKKLSRQGPVCIVTDENVAKLYGNALRDHLKCHMLTIAPAGEAAKSRETKAMIENELFRLGFGSDLTLISLGGGVVSDITGFVAATFCRGVRLTLIPTTLLAMCDAAIGGKNGVNVCTRKNAIGTVYKPHALFIDPDVLTTLSEEEYISGTAEILKHGLIWDKKLWDFMQNEKDSWQWRKPDFLQKIIEWNLRIKQTIIEENKRDLLNFGHTVGHAVEMLENISHGHAIAKGMWLETLWSKGFDQEIFDGLQNFGFNLSLEDLDPKTLWEIMLFDKKKHGPTLYAVALEKIGRSAGLKPMEFDALLSHFSHKA